MDLSLEDGVLRIVEAAAGGQTRLGSTPAWV